jgi:predicted Rossmann-fold nucleotide-binding protein
VIAVDGSYGTLSEIAIALNYGKPVVGLETWRISQPDVDDEEHIVRADGAAQAVEMAVAAAGGGS